jgi:hypothetical protein
MFSIEDHQEILFRFVFWRVIHRGGRPRQPPMLPPPAAGRAQSAPEQGPRSPGAPRSGQARWDRQNGPKTTIFRNWRPARTMRTMRAARHFWEMVCGERFLPQNGPGAARGPTGRRRRLGGPLAPAAAPPALTLLCADAPRASCVPRFDRNRPPRAPCRACFVLLLACFDALLVSPRSNPPNRPGSRTMPECRFNKYNATSRLFLLQTRGFLRRSQPARARSVISWRRPRRFGSTSISLLLSPLLRAPLHPNLTLTSSTPLTSPTTSSPPMAHERASSTLLKVVAFASRSFTSPINAYSGFRPT